MLLIPFYFFAAVGAFLAVSLLCRLLRLALTANLAAVVAALLGLTAVVAPLLTGGAQLTAYSPRWLVALLVGTFALAALDLVVERRRPLPLDRELGET